MPSTSRAPKRRLPKKAQLDSTTSKAIAEFFATAGNLEIKINYRSMDLEITGSQTDQITRIPLDV